MAGRDRASEAEWKLWRIPPDERKAAVLHEYSREEAIENDGVITSGGLNRLFERTGRAT